MGKEGNTYKDPNRFAPPAGIEVGETSIVRGYQAYSISDRHIEIDRADSSLMAKKDLVSFILDSEWIRGKSILDLGANSAYFAFASLLKGAKKAVALDMDKQYIEIVKRIAAEHGYRGNIDVIEGQVSDYAEAADLTFAFALVHWVYSCTEGYGSLDAVIGKFAELTNEVLVIEWIDPSDKAMKEFDHISFGKEIQSEEYTRENFEAALGKHFGKWEIAGETRPGRELYIAYKQAGLEQELKESQLNMGMLDIFISLNEAGVDYRVLRNGRILSSQLDDFGDRTVDICIYHEQYPTVLAHLSNFAAQQNTDEWGATLIIGLAEEAIALRLIKSDSAYLSESMLQKIWQDSHKSYGLKTLSQSLEFFYLVHYTVYVLGAAENAYEEYLNGILDSIEGFGEELKLSDFSSLNKILQSSSNHREDPNELLLSFSLPYLFEDIGKVHYSRILDFNTPTPYISRIYKLENGQAIKQASLELINNEHKALSILAEKAGDMAKHFPEPSELTKDKNSGHFTMKWFDGPKLKDLLQAGISESEASIFIKQLDDILEVLSLAGIKHRDINPSNIIFNEGTLKLIDFGWAIVNEEDGYTPIGLNPGYKPETDTHSDMYSIESIKDEILGAVEQKESTDFRTIEESDPENIDELLEELSTYKDGESISASGILYRLASECYKSGKLEEARGYLEEELIIKPESKETLELLEKIEKEFEGAGKEENISAFSFQENDVSGVGFGSIADDEEEFISVDSRGFKYDVSIAIPVLNNPELTQQCLDSIFRHSDSKTTFEVIAIDNGSDEKTKEVLASFSDMDNYRIITNQENLGFAKSINQAAKEREGRDLLLLNNDILTTPGWLDGLLMHKSPDTGVIGCLLLYPNTEIIQHAWVNIGTEDGRTLAPYHVHQYADINNNEISQEINSPRNVDAVTGACMLISSRALDEAGLLDETYQNGLEDIDYCIRVRQLGMDVVYSPDTILYHYESMSKGRHDKDIQNWQHFNRTWLGTYQIKVSQEETAKHVAQIKSRQQGFDKDALPLQTKENKVPNLSTGPELSIVILTHNNIDYTITCLESLFRTLTVEAEVIVVDNASDDDTIIYLENLGSRIKLIQNPENYSFSKANNIGAGQAKGNYLLFLNNDVELLPGWCDFLLSHFERNPETGVQGAKLLYPNGQIQHAGIVFGKVGHGQSMHYHIYLTHDREAPEVNKTREFQMVTGAMIAIRRGLFNEVGGFDEQYQFGYEDMDICLKAKQQGFNTIYNHEVEAYHYESITKKSEGLFKFESFLRNPDGMDAKNNEYFREKWKNHLISDADLYYLEDGFYGLVSEKDRSSEYIQRIEKFHKLASEAIKSKGEHLKKKLSQLLYSNEDTDFISDPHKLVRTSVFALANAESELGISTREADPSEWKSASSSLPRILMTMFGWAENGGGTILPRSIAKKLAADGFEVAVFYADTENSRQEGKEYGSVRVKEHTESGVKLYAVSGREIAFTSKDRPLSEIEDENVVRAFEDIIDDFNPDIIHFHNFVGLSFSIADIAAKKEIKTFYTPHNYHFIDPALYLIGPDLKRWQGTNLLENADIPDESLENDFKKRISKAKTVLRETINYTLTVSNRQRSILKDFLGYGGTMSTVNQIAESASFRRGLTREINRNSTLRIGYIGSVMPHKGVHLLPVAGELFEEGKIEIHIFGDSSGQYDTFIKQLSSKSKVYFHGEYSELPDISKLVDVIVLPSLWEDCAPLVIAEALSRNTPCVVPDIGGFSDFIIDGYNGLLFTAGSAHSLAKQLGRLESDRDLLAELTKNSRLAYSFDDFVAHVETLYQKAFYGINLIEEEMELSFRDKLLKSTDESTLEKAINSESTSVDSKAYPRYGFTTKKATGRLPNPLPETVRLNLGCGKDIRDGFINIDLYSDDPRVVGMDIRSLDLPNDVADQIIASDIIEHFPHRETRSILNEWNRVLKPGGTIIIRCPNLRLQTQAYLRGDWNADVASYMIFGGQTNPGDYHYVAFDHDTITAHLHATGFELKTIKDEDYPQNKGYINLNMVVTAVKSENGNKKEKRKNIQQSHKQTDEVDIDSKIEEIRGKISKIVDVPQAREPQINLVWEGSQMLYHSLALVNRELCNQLIDHDNIELSIIPYEVDKIDPLSNKKYARLFAKDIRVKGENPAAKGKPFLWVRHQWPPKAEPPRGSKWIIIQPWELDILPNEFISIFKKADEIWTPSNFSRQAYLNSGIDPAKVQVIQNGINPEIYKPQGEKYRLNTKAGTKFLFVGGTLSRKGINILIEAYSAAFDSESDVCLVIKDMGGESFYKGINAKDYLKEKMATEGFPEIVYIDEELSEEEMASLYRACDVFVSPYRGEGFSLPALEAMACGCVPIVTKGGATDDFVDEETGWRINATLEEVSDDLAGLKMPRIAKWLVPDKSHLELLLKTAYFRPEQVRLRSKLGAIKAHSEWTWSDAAIKVLKRIDYLYGLDLCKAYLNRIDIKKKSYLKELNWLRGLSENNSDLQDISLPQDTPKDYAVFAYNLLASRSIASGKKVQAETFITKARGIQANIDSSILEYQTREWKDHVECINYLTELLEALQTQERPELSLGFGKADIINAGAEVMIQSGDIEGALQMLGISISSDPTKSHSYALLAEYYEQMGEKEKADSMKTLSEDRTQTL